MQLANKTALITGGGRGLGRAIALAYAREGAAVVVAARSDDEIAETAWLIEEMGQRAKAIVADVQVAAQVEALVAQTQATFGPIHVLVNSAGVGFRGPVQEMDEAQWDGVVNTLLKGTFLVTRAVLPGMISNGQGNIINLGAPLERIITPGFAAYTAAKYGVEGLTRVLAKDLRRYGINVNAIHPGGFADTRLVRATVPEVTQGLMSPEVVTAAAVALAAQGGRGQTGQIIDAHTWGKSTA
ncbi:MAG: SDR family oxidoreductase [Chloroflexaceae bacterium]|jgi:3-oxoacyl-[acyl-carrier protein] reductase|nr:SDR family oxidoreductase [Chloroflexaceae bacterium]